MGLQSTKVRINRMGFPLIDIVRYTRHDMLMQRRCCGVGDELQGLPAAMGATGGATAGPVSPSCPAACDGGVGWLDGVGVGVGVRCNPACPMSCELLLRQGTFGLRVRAPSPILNTCQQGWEDGKECT